MCYVCTCVCVYNLQASEEATLREFEALLMEMFSESCDNTRIREIGKEY